MLRWRLISLVATAVVVGCATQADNGDAPGGGESGSSSSAGSGGNQPGGGSGGNASGGGGAGKGGSASAGMSGSGSSMAGTGGSATGGDGGMSMGGMSTGGGGAGGSGGKGGSGGSAGSGGKGGSGGAAGSGGKGGSGDQCKNGAVDAGETDADCGGTICTARCDTGKACEHAGDCIQVTGNINVCDNSTCRDQGCNQDDCAYALTRYILGAQLAKGQAFVTWDSESLDITIEMRDATPQNDSDPNWEDDSVEIYLDLNNAGTGTYEADDFQITVPRAAGALSGVGNYDMGMVMVQRTSDAMGYTLQIEIPWAALNGAASQVGKTIGFDIGVNEDSNGGTRDGQIMLYGNDQNYQNTSAFGELVLTP